MEFTLNLTAERSVARESLKGTILHLWALSRLVCFCWVELSFRRLGFASICGTRYREGLMSPHVDTNILGILWAIFFHRLFGPVVPVTNEFLGIPYPMAAGVPDIDSAIDQKIDQLIKQKFSSPTNATSASVGQIVVGFSHKIYSKSKKKSGWFGSVKEDNPADAAQWETWIINVNCLPISYQEPSHLSGSSAMANSAERMLRLSALSFEDKLNEVISIVDKNKDHIPPIMTLDVLPFSYEISVDPPASTALSPAADDDTWTQYIKKLMD